MADEKKRIIDYPETNTVGDDDFLLMSQYNDQTEQYDSKKIKATKVGGGGGAILGTSEPTAATGEDTELYYLMQEQAGFNYLRFDTAYDRNNENWCIEYGDIRFKNAQNSYFDFTGATVELFGFDATSDCPAINAIDNDSSTCVRYNGVGTNDYPIQLIITLANPINTNNYNTFELWTGRYVGYLPKNFSLYGSTDGINWIKLFGVVDDQTATEVYGKGYTTSIPEIDFNNLIVRDYVKYNGDWLLANFNVNNLSLKERVVDILNGKPLYQKTIRVTNFNTYSFASVGLGNDVDTKSIKTISNFHRFEVSANGEVYTGQAYYYGDAGNWWRFYFDTTNKNLVTAGAWTYGRMEFFITIQYIKQAA